MHLTISSIAWMSGKYSNYDQDDMLPLQIISFIHEDCWPNISINSMVFEGCNKTRRVPPELTK